MATKYFAALCVAVAQVNGAVIELTEANFEEMTTNGDVWMVDFMSSTCGFCKLLYPDWEKFSDYADAHPELNLKVAKLDVREHRAISQQQQIGKLPQIKLFRDGQVFKLPSSRSSHSTEEYTEYALETYQEVEDAELARIAEEERIQAEIDAKSKVVALNVDNFEEHVMNGETWLIEFYGPKCGYCKRLAPRWEELGFGVEEAGRPFRVAKFDAAAGFKYTHQFKANPWPSLKLVKNGQVYSHPSSRETMEVQEYMDWVENAENTAEAFLPDFMDPSKPKATTTYTTQSNQPKPSKKKTKKTKKTKKKKPLHDEL